jgi:putative ABC transport system ATP-binding protein
MCRIELRNLDKVYRTGKLEYQALKNVNLTIDGGELTAIVGPSGSGKSTVLNMITGIDRPTRGEILVDGCENAMLPMDLAGKGTVDERRKTAMRNLELVGLGKKLDNLPSELSGGEQQRVAIARALANDPKIIIGDEPTGNLDSKTEAMVFDLLLKLNKQGKTIVFVTHSKELARRADRRITILDGMVAEA